jgi:2-oxoglutarate/2-oxoacid ferredoxin oxidoreductase subunit beta
MPSIAKPIAVHPSLHRNAIGLNLRDYEGAMSTLCAGCGHDSITAAITRALWELSIEPHMIAKLSGIGCSSKTPTYFVSGAHGFNSAHGRMAAIATGANAANRELTYIGISGDGDSLSIGLGHLCHAIRRNVNMLYVIENNGVYGLTKGQFSATADLGSKLKTGVINELPPIDTCELAVSLGATFVGRSFSGDKRQLHAMLKAAIAHNGTVLLDVVSPCVTFNDHEGSTKSYKYMIDHEEPLQEISFIPVFEDIAVDYDPGTTLEVEMHDGSKLRLRKLEEDYDPTNKIRAITRLNEAKEKGEMLTGVLYVNTKAPTFIDMLNMTDQPLATIPASATRPGPEVLEQVMEELR